MDMSKTVLFPQVEAPVPLTAVDFCEGRDIVLVYLFDFLTGLTLFVICRPYTI